MSNDISRYARKFIAKKGIFFGRRFSIYNDSGNLIFFSQQALFKLKEAIVVYADQAKTQPMLKINARSIIDFGATYDVTDAITGEAIGAARRAGLKSILRDEWSVLSPGDSVLYTIQEDSMMLALIRRFLMNLIPQSFSVLENGQKVGEIRQRFNPFQMTYDVDFSQVNQLDPRLGVATVILLLAIEGRQK